MPGLPSDQGDDGAFADIRPSGDVDHDLVHGDAAENRAMSPADEDRSAVGKAAEQTVAVTDRDHGDGCAPGGAEGGPVTDGGSGGEGFEAGDPGFPREDGAELLLEAGHGADAIEGDPGPDTGAVGGGKGKHAGAVAGVAN